MMDMSTLFATRRDLDAWARCLGVDNDDDAIGKLTTIAAKVGSTREVLTDAYRTLNQVRDFGGTDPLRRAAARMDNAYGAIGEALRGFYVHERG